MKVGIISDLHLKFWNKNGPTWLEYVREGIVNSVAKEKPDLLIDAGDYELDLLSKWLYPGRGYTDEINVEQPRRTNKYNLNTELFSVKGNHDWYGKEFHPYPASTLYEMSNGIKVFGTTLWTNCNEGDPRTIEILSDWMMDEKSITGFRTQDSYKVHLGELALLQTAIAEEHPDMIVTHHCPSFKSVHEQYKRHAEHTDNYKVNYGFASHLDEVVERSGAKLWIHGHTHKPFDYMIGNTRVICNPLGYPNENNPRNDEDYKPVYVEIPDKEVRLEDMKLGNSLNWKEGFDPIK